MFSGQITHKHTFIYFLLFFFTFSSCKPQSVTLKNKIFIDSTGQYFYPMIMNYEVELAYDSLPLTLNHIKIQRPSQIGLDGHFCCGGFDNGINNITQDFYEIKNLGFNTIRLILKPIKSINTDGFYLQIEDYPSGTPYLNKSLQINPPYNPDLNLEMNFYLSKLLKIIRLAEKLNLHIICPLGQDSPEIIMKSNQDDYLNFIRTVSAYIHKHQPSNILAYELIGEPTYAVNKNNPETHYSKCQACKFVNKMVDTINKYDPGKMTTIGAVFFDDPFPLGWDPNFLNTDFINIHIYPQRDTVEYTYNKKMSLDNSVIRYLNNIQRFCQFINKPFVIGETGFFAENSDGNPNLVFPYAVYGNEYDQYEFVKNTFRYIYANTIVSGYGWWQLNNYHFFGNPNPFSNPNNLKYSLSQYAGDHCGILRHGNPTNDLLNGWAIHRKKASEIFIDFKDSLLDYDSMPSVGPSSDYFSINDIYYNPSLTAWNDYSYPASNGKTFYGHIRGYVVDQYGQPIQNAIIKTTNIDALISNPDSTISAHLLTSQVFTDINGYFEAYTYDSRPNNNGHSDPNLDKTFDDIKISAFGSLPIERGWNGMPINEIETYILFSLESKLKNNNIYSAKINCEDICELESEEKLSSLIGNIRAFPNPTHGQIKVSLINMPDKINEVLFYSANGELLSQYNFDDYFINLNFTDYKPGVYLLKICTNNRVFNLKIILIK